MFTIGDFARHGRVSVRMLRHYDAIGLLRPARVDPASGYRFYAAAQLTRLNRIIALKDLGFTLQQVQTILDERIRTDELHGMLRLRRAELEARMNADAHDHRPRLPAGAVALREEYDFAVVDLPAIESAATIVHRGSMDEVVATDQILARWLDAHGYRATGYSRELYLDCPEGALDRWVTELQTPVEKS